MISQIIKYLESLQPTKDNPILRMSSLAKESENLYHCKLQRSTYYYQVRTNLTIDYPLLGQMGNTLRALDLTPEGKLPSLEKSALVNSIGVSAVVFFWKGRDLYFLMKYRKPTEAVYPNMFGTTSGVVTIPPGQPVRSLTDYVTSEMRREFYRETGFDEDRDNRPIKNMILLSFVRELIRGGKPQFFFLIEIDEITEKQFRRKFRTSAEGLEEFYDNPYHNNKYSTALSPEFGP